MATTLDGAEFRPLPEEIVELFDMAAAAKECRDICVRSLFRARRAIFYGKQDIKHRRQAWDLVYELYPDMKDATVTYTPGKGVRFGSFPP
jgi:hypothetical protein